MSTCEKSVYILRPEKFGAARLKTVGTYIPSARNGFGYCGRNPYYTTKSKPKPTYVVYYKVVHTECQKKSYTIIAAHAQTIAFFLNKT